ncbi:MAG: hypothetical protein KAT09_00485 [Candidatus Aegiribacteria sp.]|nr:hypothetical protein [Candidatus Aegiribacteria sp.]
MKFIRAIFTVMVQYSFYVFILFSLVVSLLSGFSDVIYHSRRTAAQEEWMREAEAEREEYIEVDYTPNLVTGIAAFVMFAVSSVLAVSFFMKKLNVSTHVLLIAVTVLAAFIFFLPRPPIGTGTEKMKEVFAYLMFLGIIDSSLYRTYILKSNPVDRQTVQR